MPTINAIAAFGCFSMLEHAMNLGLNIEWKELLLHAAKNRHLAFLKAMKNDPVLGKEFPDDNVKV
jgi:hypothetical protein